MTLRVGVVGLGFMGRTHLAAYAKAANAGFANKIVAVCDRDPELRAGRFGAGRGNIAAASASERLFDPSAVRAYESPPELFADPDVDVVSICTYTPTHVPLALEALAAKKHVLVEKPVALRSEDAVLLSEAARSAGTTCMPAMCMRFWPGWSWLEARVADGSFGKVRSASFRRLGGRPGWGQEFYDDDDACGSALFDLHVHDADFVLFAFGAPQAVTSVGSPRHLTTVYHYDRGPSQVTAEGGWLPSPAFPFEMRYRVVFEQAIADFDFARDPALLLYEGAESRPVDIPSGDGYEHEIAHFLEVVQTGRRKLRATLEDACTLTRVLEHERKSLNEGRAVAFSSRPSGPRSRGASP